MKVISVVNEKGGVGKSTITYNLAVAAALEGKKVLVIDADTQASTMSVRELRQDNLINAVQITKNTIHKDINNFSNFDLIIVDAGGRDTSVFRSAIMASSAGMLVVPVQPSAVDIWATEETFNIIQDIRTYLPIDAYVVLNQVVSNTTLAKDAKEALEEITTEKEVKILNSVLHSRMDYKKSVNEGKGVLEFNPSGKAAQEVNSLYAEIKATLFKEMEGI